jgi:hypothetical protein
VSGFVPLSYKQLPEISRQVTTIESFRGVDFRNTPTSVDKSRSPDSLNMVRDGIGQIRKRMGYKTVRTYPGRINGAYSFGGRDLIHAGNRLYDGETELGQVADTRSQGWTLQKKLYLLDGEKLRVYDGKALAAVEDLAYVPTLMISRAPKGGGTAFEAVNLLGTRFKNSFLGEANVTAYQLTDGDLDDSPVTVQVLTSGGTWADRTEGTHFTVNRTTGVVTFTSAPGASPVLGMDNVVITAGKKREGYRERINCCTISTLFGVNGAADRLFVSGNPQYPNQDWYSEQNDPSYFGDLSYSVLGLDSSAVKGYSVIADRLAAHKDASEDGRNVILRSGTLLNGKAAFPIVGTLQGEGSLASATHTYLGREPLFLTRRGVYAITAEDVTGEKYSQNRSYRLDSKLLSEPGLEDAVACVYNDCYLLAVGDHVYVLDGLQKTYAKGEPYSAYQYEAYLWDNIPARILWVHGGKLYFGTEEGQVKAFYTDPKDLASYTDDGAAIRAYWDTPYFSGKIRHNKKWFTYLSVTLAPHSQTSVKVYAKVYGIWKLLIDDQNSARYFDFNSIDFEKFTFSTDTSPRNIHHKIDLRYVDKVMLRLENDAPGEPFGIYDLTLEYTEGGKF